MHNQSGSTAQTWLICLAGLAGVVLLATGPVIAREPGIPYSSRTFKRIDTNKDGKMALSELAPKSVRRFMLLDANKDGEVTRSEVKAWLEGRLQRRLKRIMTRLDTNADKVITRKELEGVIASQFAAADTNADGGITRKEARAYHIAKRKKYRHRRTGN